MASWLDTLDNPQAVVSVFGDVVPSLKGVALHEVTLHREGPHAVLRFDIAEYPEKPPAKWARQGYNRIQLELRLDIVRRASIEGWDSGGRADLELRRGGAFVVLMSRSGPCKLEIKAEMARVMRVTPYVDGSR